ncbi:MAG: multiheme c-type cytochrome [Acidobacteriota bacterium]
MKRVVLLCLVLAMVFAVAVMAQQPPASRPPAAAPATATTTAAATTTAPPEEEMPSQPGHYVGVGSCINSGCHGSTEPLASTGVLQNEFYTWLNKDHHSKAYNILLSDRSARIARNMRLKKAANEEGVCLDCHTTNVPRNMIVKALDREDGVQCEMCHGPAGGWFAEHSEGGWSHEQSVSRGMIDLRAINSRGTTCAGCHLGNAKKEVDHELIASGHPILAFELDNYTESMPPHWALRYDGGRETHGVRAWAVGQVINFREGMDNLARHARGNEWPEFSEMSCFNCHHDLKDSGWRQERGWSDRAGLPAWSPQRWAVLRLILERVSPGVRNELDPLVAEISRGVSRMNNPAGVAASADRARALVSPLVARVDAARWNDSDVRELMTTITNDREVAYDVLTAEQAALALQSLSSMRTRRDPRLLKGSLTRSIDALFDELKSRDDYQPSRFSAKMAAVRAAI